MVITLLWLYLTGDSGCALPGSLGTVTYSRLWSDTCLGKSSTTRDSLGRNGGLPRRRTQT